MKKKIILLLAISIIGLAGTILSGCAKSGTVFNKPLANELINKKLNKEGLNIGWYKKPVFNKNTYELFTKKYSNLILRGVFLRHNHVPPKSQINLLDNAQAVSAGYFKSAMNKPLGYFSAGVSNCIKKYQSENRLLGENGNYYKCAGSVRFKPSIWEKKLMDKTTAEGRLKLNPAMNISFTRWLGYKKFKFIAFYFQDKKTNVWHMVKFVRTTF